MFAEISGLDREEIRALVAECRDKLELVDIDLMSLGKGQTSELKEVINRVFRVFHSVKAAAGYLQHEPLKELSHITETLLDRVREGGLQLSSNHVDVLLSAADRMRLMVATDELSTGVDFSRERQALAEILQPSDNSVDAEMAEASSEPPARRLVPAPVAPQLKVLIVEDDFTSRLTLQSLLPAHSEFHIAVNGMEAVKAFTAAKQSGKGYDLICMDINMPEMDGQAALKSIREIEAKEGIFRDRVRIFMTTSKVDLKTVRASFEDICDAYIIKPVDGNELQAQLTSFQLLPSAG
jgi:two-component system chemotaxis response regulator CheY